MLSLLLACSGGPAAIVASDRSGHWLDRPFPSDELRDEDGLVEWTVMPAAPTDLGDKMVTGWKEQASLSVHGFGHFSSVTFRFEAPLEGLQASYPGSQEDPIRLCSSDGECVPITVNWLDSALGDPFLADNSLRIAPDPRSPLRPGTTYTAVVDESLASRAEGWEPPEGEAFEDAAVTTTFTVQDSLGELAALKAAVEASLLPEHLDTELVQVAGFRYEQGETASGKATTMAIATYMDGSEQVTEMYASEGRATSSVDFLEDWPFDVYEARIRTLAFQGLEDAPYAASGLGLLGDFDRRHDGWIEFSGSGELLNDWETEEVRVLIQVPKEGSDFGVMTWDHGTGGSAYNAVARISSDTSLHEVAEALASAGVVVVSRDQPLYGLRYPLIDEGFGASLGFYNIGNLPAFRDNERQAAVDHVVLNHFVREELPQHVDTDGTRIGSFGHSLGSVTAHIGLAMEQGEGAQSAFMSGSGGYYTHYVLGTGLFANGGNSLTDTLEPLIGVDPATATPGELVAALVGLPEESWGLMDEQHPILQLFQAVMDGADPLALAPHQEPEVAEFILLGVDDYQVPNETTRWLGEALPNAVVEDCQRREDYDGHYCTFREPEGHDALHEWASGI
jgi:hypothetical protein